ncbi:hypothetical protein J5J86_15920 [Aquabacter sp. L1I39]|nr:hypothetical protein [Aquabacter sp. L1I39]QTL02277.1 hypothetical protein J5J86_15920 [Aquabacter sp. L1I39]
MDPKLRLLIGALIFSAAFAASYYTAERRSPPAEPAPAGTSTPAAR